MPTAMNVQLLALPVSFLLAAALTTLVIRLARERGWIDTPSEERWHKTPTALMGGIGIFVAAGISFTVFLDLAQAWPFLVGAGLLFISGVWDDRVGLSPSAKIIFQIAASAVFVTFSGAFDFGITAWAEAPVTMFWLIGVTNAVNLIDNMDGLSSGISAIAGLCLGMMGVIAGSPFVLAAALAVTGAAAGFLLYNRKPAKIFMGDCGSLFLGFSLAALAVVVQQTMSQGVLSLFMPIMVLAVPIIDTTVVTVVRTLYGRPVSAGGRDHTSHRLVFLGLGDRKAVRVLYAVAAGFGALAVWFYVSELTFQFAIVSVAFLAAVSFGVFLATPNVYGENAESLPRDRRSLLRRLLTLPPDVLGTRWKPVFAVLADALTVVAAFAAAFVLRYGSDLEWTREAVMRQTVPFVLLVRLPIFAWFGLYRAIWRHAGALELVKLVFAVTTGSLLIYSGMVAYFGPVAVSQGLIVIDWMAAILGVMMTRFGFRGLGSYVSAKADAGTPVAIYGASDDALMTVRYLRTHPGELGLRPVAIISDGSDPAGSTVQGLSVYGELDDLKALSEETGIDGVVFPNDSLSAEEKEAVKQACREAQIRCMRLEVSVHEDESLND